MKWLCFYFMPSVSYESREVNNIVEILILFFFKYVFVLKLESIRKIEINLHHLFSIFLKRLHGAVVKYFEVELF